MSRRPESNGANVRKQRKNHTHSLGSDELRHAYYRLLLIANILFALQRNAETQNDSSKMIFSQHKWMDHHEIKEHNYLTNSLTLFYRDAYAIADRGHKEWRTEKESKKKDWIWLQKWFVRKTSSGWLIKCLFFNININIEAWEGVSIVIVKFKCLPQMTGPELIQVSINLLIKWN